MTGQEGSGESALRSQIAISSLVATPEKENEGSNLIMQGWLRKAVAAFPVSAWLLSLGGSYVLGTVALDCVCRRYAEAAFRAGMVVYILPTLVATLRRHPNLRLLLLTNSFLGVTLAGWFVCFVWSWYKHAKTKHMLLTLMISFMVVGVGIDVFRSCTRTQDAAFAEELWLTFSITAIAGWMVFALLQAMRVMKNEKENKTIGCDRNDAAGLRE